MKTSLAYLLIFISITYGCKRQNYQDELALQNLEKTQSSNTKKAPVVVPPCQLPYTFNGGISFDPLIGSNNFIFTWDFDFAMLPCQTSGSSTEIAIEFRALPGAICGPNGNTNSNTTPYYYTHVFPNISRFNYNPQSQFFTPISGNMIHAKIFEYRTVITLVGCGVNCTVVEGDWQGPLCSYMF